MHCMYMYVHCMERDESNDFLLHSLLLPLPHNYHKDNDKSRQKKSKQQDHGNDDA